MKIYRISPYTGNKYAYIQDTGFREVVRDIIKGIRVEKPEDKFILKNISKKFPDLMGTGSSELFLSDELKLFFENFIEKQDLNFIPYLINKKQYWLLNIVGLRDCMDYDKSDYSTYNHNGFINEIKNLVVREEKINAFDIFRLKDKPVNIFVTESIKLKMEELKFEGIDFEDNMDLTFG